MAADRHQDGRRLAFYASRQHYAAHLVPYSRRIRKHVWWVPETLPDRVDDGWLVVVGSADDAVRVGARGARVVYVEHGAGQTYDGDPRSARHPGYSSGPLPDRVVAAIVPRAEVGERLMAANSAIRRYAAVGCPKLEDIEQRVQTQHRRTIGLAWHWDCAVAVESDTAWYDWAPQLDQLVGAWGDSGWTVIGTRHPRASRRVDRRYAELGVETVGASEILAWAHVLVADNTSLMYEFAALDRPVIALNARKWRKDVEHGLRFWSHVPGWDFDPHLDADEPLHQLDIDRYVSEDPSGGLRRRVVGHVYGGAHDAAPGVALILDERTR